MISEARRRMKRRRVLVSAVVIAISLAGTLFGVHSLAPSGPPSLQSEGTAQGHRGATGRVRGARLSAEAAARLAAERAAREAAARLAAERAAREAAARLAAERAAR